MSGYRLALMAVVGVLLGATAGFMLGWLLLALGFEFLGTAMTLAGGLVGGIAGFMGVLFWSGRRGS